jgi:hypothetical protein
LPAHIAKRPPGRIHEAAQRRQAQASGATQLQQRDQAGRHVLQQVAVHQRRRRLDAAICGIAAHGRAHGLGVVAVCRADPRGERVNRHTIGASNPKALRVGGGERCRDGRSHAVGVEIEQLAAANAPGVAQRDDRVQHRANVRQPRVEH